MKLLILMAQLMTRIPIPMQVNVQEKELGRGNIYFPMIGMVIGLFMAGVYQVASYLYSPEGLLIPILTVVAYLWITGGLHMDGLSDTFDGLWSNRSRERMLEIMKDSRLGAFGALVMLLTMLLQVGSLQELFSALGRGVEPLTWSWAGSPILTGVAGTSASNWIWVWLILLPALGRYGAVFGNAISTYARPDGMGKFFIQDCGLREWLISSLYVIPLVIWLLGVSGIGAVGIVLIFTYFFTKWVDAKLGGITGDIIGAVIELNQLVLLLYLVALI